MARIREKTLKFPGLDNVYTFADEADLFDASVDCIAGRYYIYDGDTYFCKSNHTGAWSAADFTKVKLGNEITAVKSFVDDVANYEAEGKVPVLTKLLDGYGLNTTTGAIVEEATFTITDYIPVAGGEKIYLSNNSRNSGGNALYTSEKEFINAFDTFLSDKEVVINIPENAGYLILGNKTANMYPQIYRKNKIVEGIAFRKYFDESTVIEGFINGSNGSFVASSGWRATDFIEFPLPQGGYIDVVSTLYGNGGIAFYDYNKNYISGINGNTASASGYSGDALPKYRHYAVPASTCYVRFCIYLYSSEWTAKNMYIADATLGMAEMSKAILTLDKSIYAMNETESMYVNAGANYGHHSGGSSNTQKRFSMLVTTDVHGDNIALSRAIEYLNMMKCFDCGVTLGDLQPSDFSDNDGTWYTNVIKNSKKSWLTLIGNHDVGLGRTTAKTGDQEQVYNKFIAPNYQYAGIEDPEHSYYYKDFSTYKIRLICLCAYDVDNDTLDANDDYVVARYTEYYSQAQITWLVNTLASVPSDYQVIVMVHNTPKAATKDTSIHFNNKTYNLSQETTQNGIIADIIDAWQSGTTLSNTYACSNTNLDDVTVSADFTSRGAGVFICYLTGHMHVDFVGSITGYSSQKIIALSATNAGTYQNGDDDLPRADNTKAEDCITSFAVDTTNKNIYIVRLGSSVSKYFDVREPSVISYA